MSIEIFSERHLSVVSILDPHPPAASVPPQLESRLERPASIANSVIRRIGAEAGPCSTSPR
jgi:hypothetical protein